MKLSNELSHTIKLRIQALAKEQGISLYQLSHISSMTQSTVNNLMNRETNSPMIATIKRLCDGLGITLAKFFDTDDFMALKTKPTPKNKNKEKK